MNPLGHAADYPRVIRVFRVDVSLVPSIIRQKPGNMNVTENQFSLNRAASLDEWQAKKRIAISWNKAVKKPAVWICATAASLALIASACAGTPGNQITVSAPMTTDLSGKTMDVAFPSVFRVVCNGRFEGTGFLHRSGRVITAFHVVHGCSPKQISIVRAEQVIPGVRTLQTIAVTNVVTDANSDLALLTPAQPIKAPSLPLSTNFDYKIGSQVCTWGFPAGYTGLAPLLSAGYLSGVQWNILSNGVGQPTLVVNAAFNGGNSGGPLVDVESGAVIGIVVSKLAPLPQTIEMAIAALKSNRSGFGYDRTYADGRKESLSEAQVLAEVLDYLRSQVQLVIGYAATRENLQKFLMAQGIDP